MDLSTRSLERALSIRRQIDILERRLRRLVSRRSGAGIGVGSSGPRRRRMSAAARAKIAAAARARWARVKARRGGVKTVKRGNRPKGGITAAGRRRLSRLMKARWAARRKARRH